MDQNSGGLERSKLDPPSSTRYGILILHFRRWLLLVGDPLAGFHRPLVLLLRAAPPAVAADQAPHYRDGEDEDTDNGADDRADDLVRGEGARTRARRGSGRGGREGL